MFLTDSRAVARSYAVWESAAQAALGSRPPHRGAVVTVTTPATLAVEQHSYPPPLPWETRMLGGVSYFTTQPIAAEQLGPFDVWEIDEMRDPRQLAAVIREHEFVCDAIPREDAAGSAAPMIRRCSLHDAIPDVWAFLDAIVAASPNATSRWHGQSHWLGVTAAAIRILERGCEADPAVLLAFCLLHDSQRHSEGHDPAHGERAAAFAHRLYGESLHLDTGQRDVLRRALVDHDRGGTSDDATIGACWDADRLTLPRVGIKVNPRMLSTAEGRELAGEPGSIPRPSACDWDWALSRVFLLATTSRRRVRA